MANVYENSIMKNRHNPQYKSHYEQFVHMSANIKDRVDKHSNKGLV